MAISVSLFSQPTTAEPHAAGEPYKYGYQTTEATGDPEVVFIECRVFVGGSQVATNRQYPVTSASGVKRFIFDIQSTLKDNLSWDYQAEGATGDNHCSNSEKTVYVELEHYTRTTPTGTISASGTTTTSNTTHAINARYHPRETDNDLSGYINNTTTPGKLLHDWYDADGNAIDQVTRLTDAAFIYYWNDPLAATGATEIKIQKYQGGTAGAVDYYILSGTGNIGGTPLKGMFAFACGPANINALGTGDWDGSGITIDDKADRYVVTVGRLLTGGSFQATHKPVTFIYDSAVCGDHTRYQWMNYRGGIDTYYFEKWMVNTRPTSTSFIKPDSSTFSVSDYNRAKTLSKAVEGFVLVAEGLTNDQALWLSDITTALTVQEVNGSNRYEVFVPDQDLEVNRQDGLEIEWEINADYSKHITSWRR